MMTLIQLAEGISIAIGSTAAKVRSLGDHCRLPNARDHPHQSLAMLSPSQDSWSTSNLGADATVVGDDGKGQLE